MTKRPWVTADILDRFDDQTGTEEKHGHHVCLENIERRPQVNVNDNHKNLTNVKQGRVSIIQDKTETEQDSNERKAGCQDSQETMSAKARSEKLLWTVVTEIFFST